MNILRTAFLVSAAAAILVPATALSAETRVVVHHPSANQILELSGGVQDYRTGLDGVTDPGSAWGARVVFGARQPLGFEAAYRGGMNNLNSASSAPGTSPTGGKVALMNNGGEALLRASLGGINGDLQPYVAAGFGFVRYNVVDRNNLSRMEGGTEFNNSTDLIVPAAAGIEAFLNERLTLGARLGYRYDFRNQVRADARSADAQAWDATANLGMAF